MIGTIFLLLIIGLIILGAIFFFTPSDHHSPQAKTATEEITDWNAEQKQADQEREAAKNREWFSEQRWLTDAEIDWAVSQLAKKANYKILPAYQFHYVRDANPNEAEAHLALPNLLNEINDSSKELVFIPVNKNNSHWSLLVYEVNTKIFYHYDTLRGMNDQYIQPLVTELLAHLLEKWQDPRFHLKNDSSIYQGNSYDCGVTVIAIIKRISEQYRWCSGTAGMGEVELGEFNFTQERKDLRATYLKNNGE